MAKKIRNDRNWEPRNEFPYLVIIGIFLKNKYNLGLNIVKKSVNKFFERW